jgi:hypothetical protein
LGLEDDFLLAVAAEDGYTLVTYDLRTIVPLLVRLAAAERSSLCGTRMARRSGGVGSSI